MLFIRTKHSKIVFFRTFYVFGSCCRTLAVILVSDFRSLKGLLISDHDADRRALCNLPYFTSILSFGGYMLIGEHYVTCLISPVSCHLAVIC